MRFLLLSVCLFVSACGGKPNSWAHEGIKPALLKKAEEVCRVNEGIKTIWSPKFGKHYVSCGEDCWKEQGLWIRGTVVCNNGGEFRINFEGIEE